MTNWLTLPLRVERRNSELLRGNAVPDGNGMGRGEHLNGRGANDSGPLPVRTGPGQLIPEQSIPGNQIDSLRLFQGAPHVAITIEEVM